MPTFLLDPANWIFLGPLLLLSSIVIFWIINHPSVVMKKLLEELAEEVAKLARLSPDSAVPLTSSLTASGRMLGARALLADLIADLLRTKGVRAWNQLATVALSIMETQVGLLGRSEDALDGTKLRALIAAAVEDAALTQQHLPSRGEWYRLNRRYADLKKRIEQLAIHS